MSDEHTPGKPPLDEFERQRAMMQDDMKAVMSLLAQVIEDIDAEGRILNRQEAEFEQAKLRGETPDPNDVDRLQRAQASLVQRCDKLGVHMARMRQQLEAVEQAANDCLFEELRRQFNAQFNTKEGL
ncbi:MAG: hypothetical protein Q8L77_14580 [Nitrospirota bacterium]|nr:hypothetical protein [Nitrospirota bacterium]